MRIKFVLPMLALMAFLLPACQEQQTAMPKIGVVDGEKLMRDSIPGQEAMKFIEAQQNGMQEKLAALQEKMEKNPADEAVQQEFQKVYSTSIQKLQAEAQNAANQVQDVIKASLNAYREQKGYDMLIYSEIMASYGQTADVTAGVMEVINKQKVEFKPIQLPQAEAAQPAPASDAPKAAQDNAQKEPVEGKGK